MKGYKEFSNIQLCVNPIDFRKGIYSLASSIEDQFLEKPLLGGLFLFTNKSKKNIRAIYCDKTGFAMWSKSLEKNTFPWPKKINHQKFTLTHDQFQWLLSGIDPWKLKPHEEIKSTLF